MLHQRQICLIQRITGEGLTRKPFARQCIGRQLGADKVQSLFLGVLAALTWGLHDFTVRRVSARADAAALYLVVLGFGALLLLPLSAGATGWNKFTPGLWAFTSATGLVYALGVYGLYRAFAIGPVRLVAPICGAYPLLSVALAVAQGQDAGAVVWLAALVVLGGIALVAQGEAGAAQGARSHAIGWSILAAVGFAVSFAMLHKAAQSTSDLPVALVARTAGFVGMLVWVMVRRIDVRPALAIWPTLLLMGALDVGGMLAVTLAGGFPRPEFASVTSSCFGLVTILLAWRFLAEPMTRAQWFGAFLVFAGVAALGLV
jgi:drug/metabolite transporter (DMT)-like permease